MLGTFFLGRRGGGYHEVGESKISNFFLWFWKKMHGKVLSILNNSNRISGTYYFKLIKHFHEFYSKTIGKNYQFQILLLNMPKKTKKFLTSFLFYAWKTFQNNIKNSFTQIILNFTTSLKIFMGFES